MKAIISLTQLELKFGEKASVPTAMDIMGDIQTHRNATQ